MAGKREIASVRGSGNLLWLIPTCAVAAAVGVFAGFCIAAASGDIIAPRTLVAGKDVGGMTRSEAARALEPTLDRLENERGVHVTLDQQEEIAYLTYGELGASFDAVSLANEAYESSHSGSVLSDGWNLLCTTLGRSNSVDPQPADGWQAEAAEKLAEATSLPAEDFSFTILDEDTLQLTKAKNGRDADRATLEVRLKEASADKDGSRTVDLPYTAVYADQGDLNAIQESLGGTMANAHYDAETKTIVPERSALNFDVAYAQQLLDAAAPGASVTVSAEAAPAQITAAELEKVLFRDLLGTYTTRVGGAAGRKSNVRLTASRVNGCVLNSGEEFNYYSLTGPFSASNGYQSAPGYQNGKTVEMDGGGACQCSSTLYAAALLANLEIVARTAHGFASDYIGLGMDATVSGGGPDFIFRNNTLYPIKIETVYSDNNRLTVNIYGTKTDDITVKMRTEVLSTTPYQEQIIETEELAPGERKVDQTPYVGYSVKTYRQLYDGNGNLISETFEANSNYKKRDRIILIGPGGAETAENEGTASEGGESAEAGAAGETGIDVPEANTGTEPLPAEPQELPPEIPGGISPTPIEEQIEQLAPMGYRPEEGNGG